MEQLKEIKELGLESDGKDKLIEKFREKAAALKMPESVRRVFDENLAKLQGLEPAVSEELFGMVDSGSFHLRPRGPLVHKTNLCRSLGVTTHPKTTPSHMPKPCSTRPAFSSSLPWASCAE